MLFDAERPQAARTATLAAHALSRGAGDSPLQGFALTNLAMMDVEYGRPDEALRIADELLSRLRLPPRAALLARTRRARALAMTGEGRSAVREMGVARGELERSLTSRDPAWTWWLDACELAGREGHMLLSLGRAEEAVPLLRRAVSLSRAPQAGGRSVLYHRVSLLKSLIVSGAWRECEPLLAQIPALLREVHSGRGRRALRIALRDLIRDPHAPASLTTPGVRRLRLAQRPNRRAPTASWASS